MHVGWCAARVGNGGWTPIATATPPAVRGLCFVITINWVISGRRMRGLPSSEGEVNRGRFISDVTPIRLKSNFLNIFWGDALDVRDSFPVPVERVSDRRRPSGIP